jgi:hypothetical protein
MSDLIDEVARQRHVARDLYAAEIERHVLALRESLVRHDENLKAWYLLESVPYFIQDRPAIIKARRDQYAMVRHALQPGEQAPSDRVADVYGDYYATNPHERTFEEQYGLSPELAHQHMHRVAFLREGLKRQCESAGVTPDKLKVLDLSANDGWMAVNLGQLGYTTDCVDLHPGNCEVARARKGARRGIGQVLCCDLHCDPARGGRGQPRLRRGGLLRDPRARSRPGLHDERDGGPVQAGRPPVCLDAPGGGRAGQRAELGPRRAEGPRAGLPRARPARAPERLRQRHALRDRARAGDGGRGGPVSGRGSERRSPGSGYLYRLSAATPLRGARTCSGAGAHAAADTLAGGVGEITGTGYARQTEAEPTAVSGVVSFAAKSWQTTTHNDWPASVKSVVLVTSADNTGKAIAAWNLQTGGGARDLSQPNTTEVYTPTLTLA